MAIYDFTHAMFCYSTIAGELTSRGFTVHFNGLHIDTNSGRADIEMVVLDDISIWAELTATVMPVEDEPDYQVVRIIVDECDIADAVDAANEQLHRDLESNPLSPQQAASSIAAAMQDNVGMFRTSFTEVD